MSGSSYVLGRICLSTGQYLVNNASCPQKGWPEAVEWDSLNGNLLVSDELDSGVWVVSPTTGEVIATLSGGSEFDGAAVDTVTGNIYTPEGTGVNSVEVSSGSSYSPVGFVQVGVDPEAVVFDPANGDLYVANTGSNNVSVIDGETDQVTASIAVGGESSGPTDLTLDSATGNLYVTGNFNSATVVDTLTNRVIDNLSLGSYGTGMTFDPQNGELYVPNDSQDTLMAINGTTNRIVANVSIFTTFNPSGDDPVTAAFDPTTGNICVTNFFAYNINVVPGSTNTMLTTIPSGNEGWGIAFDPISGHGYASNFGNDTLTVFTTIHTYPLTFVQTGLAPGTNWTLDAFDGTYVDYSFFESLGRNSTTIYEPNSTVVFSVSSANYTADPQRGSLNVTGELLKITIKFTHVPVSTGGSFTGTPGLVYYVLAGAALVVVAAVCVVIWWRKSR